MIVKFCLNFQRLPEIGEDLPNKNPLLNEDTLLPEFNSLTIEKCLPAIGKQTAEFQQEVRNVENNLKGNKKFKLTTAVKLD